MDKTAKKCTVWAVVCFVMAAAIHMIWPVFITARDGFPWEGSAFSGVVQPFLSVFQGILVSLGGALVGAAVVVNWLTTRVSVTKGAPRQLN